MGDRYKLGQVAQLATKVYDDATGDLVNPSQLTLTVYDINGSIVLTKTLSGGQVIQDGLGSFHANVTTGPGGDLTAKGFYSYAWTAVGSVGLESDWFDIVDRTPGVISLADARGELRKGSVIDDDELTRFVDAANGWLEQQCGAIIPRTVTETVTSRAGVLRLTVVPVLSITSATANAVSVDTTVWSVDSMTGLTGNQPASIDSSWPGFYSYRSRWGAGSTLAGAYSVTYLAGRNPIPPDLVRAGRRLVGHWWEVMRGGAGAPRSGGFGQVTDQPVPFLGFAVPNQVAEIVAPYLKLVGIA